MTGLLCDYQRDWQVLWEQGARPKRVLWTPHLSPIGAYIRLAKHWHEGFIGLDLYLLQRLGPWAVVLFVAGLLGILGLAILIEWRSFVRAAQGARR